LYASLLLKKLDPAHEITVLERNPEGATYGWGVVFSSLTLTAFREADYKTFKDITDQFVIWDPIDIRYRGQLIRCGGHTFAGMSRRMLLNILTQRCRELDVDLKFQCELKDFSGFPNYDLVIAADGVNSLIRKTYEEVLKPSLRVGKARYIWFGTNKVFDSFTFIICENEHGLFQAHIYPFSGDTSTFIVECDEATWLNTGLDPLGEPANIAYCEKLFADDLQGHHLLSNKSTWVSFVEVKNRHWSHSNIVLLGDAVHTAHFSIGSGTKLAMEDAIALVNGFEIHGDDIPAALKSYELDRKPRVEAIQQAAEESQAYFETLKRYKHLEPTQFAFHLLTRSGRLNYDNLRLRDPYFVDRVDRWFSRHERQDGMPTLVALPPLHTPLKIRELSLNNRVVLSPAPEYTAHDGTLTTEYANHVVQQAQSGASLILTESIAVSSVGRITAGCIGLYTDQHQAAWKQLLDEIHQHSSAKVALQLSHAGRRGSTRPRQHGLDKPLQQGGWSLLAPSALPYAARCQTPKAMDRADMDQVREEFVHAARRAQATGVDLLMINMAHGYLLGSFLSRLTNQRADDYGGSLENRLRFPLEVFDAVRAAWEKKPLAVALNATDWAEGGFEVEEATEVVRILKAHGCDLVYPLAGQTTPDDHPTYGPNFLASHSEQIRNDTGIMTITGGGITTTNQINTLLAAGSADLCILNPLHTEL
jgi:anthraniloyl-CoA monooxygenase